MTATAITVSEIIFSRKETINTTEKSTCQKLFSL